MALSGRADQGWEGPSLSLTWENDATRDSDRHFTQGARILYLSSDEPPRWIRSFSDKLPALGFADTGLKFGVELGQEIYTPENLDAVEVVEDDRPYAGWLYGSFLLQRRGKGPAGIGAMETLRLDLGIIGPESLAEQAQKKWHARDPQGWDNQLKTEPGIVFRYDRSYLFRVPNLGPLHLDAIPAFDAALGNVDIHAGIKATVRTGYNIPDRYEVTGQKTRKKFGAYFFASLWGRAVAYNLFLDGNTWKDSHSVDKEPLVGGLTAGVTLVLGLLEITGSNNYVSHEFKGQAHSDSYGSAAMVFKF